jgi:hypothetical protein
MSILINELLSCNGLSNVRPCFFWALRRIFLNCEAVPVPQKILYSTTNEHDYQLDAGWQDHN